MRILPFAFILATSFGTLTGAALADTPKFEIKDNNLVVASPLVFDSGKATLKPESADAIAFVKAFLDDKPQITILRVENYVDNQGETKANQQLTEQRALAVTKALVAKGIDCKRLVAVG